MFLPPDFAETGLHVTKYTDRPITRFQVLGERSSGTNFVKRLLGRNSPLKPTEALGWKHGFAQMMAVPADMAIICVVRRADTWAMSMFSKPWHTTPELQALPFSDFIRAEWHTVIDRPRYFEGMIDPQCLGTPLQQDRDPESGQCFRNLFALRQAKLASLVTMLNRSVTCVFLRMETAQSDPETTLGRILRGLDVSQPKAPFRPVMKRLGARFKPAIPTRPDMPSAWTADDLAFLRTQIHAEQEARLGYTYD